MWVQDRSRIYEDAIKAYKKKPELANYFNVFVTFAGEKAVDFGGVSCDFFSGFWEGAYVEMFDGATLLAPASTRTTFGFWSGFYLMGISVVDSYLLEFHRRL